MKHHCTGCYHGYTGLFSAFGFCVSLSYLISWQLQCTHFSLFISLCSNSCKASSWKHATISVKGYIYLQLDNCRTLKLLGDFMLLLKTFYLCVYQQLKVCGRCSLQLCREMSKPQTRHQTCNGQMCCRQEARCTMVPSSLQRRWKHLKPLPSPTEITRPALQHYMQP